MENIYSHYGKVLQAVLKAQGFEGDALAGISLVPSKNAAHGEMATNAALILANRQKKNPREVAAPLAKALAAEAGIARAEIAGAGFINLFLEKQVWQGLVRSILEAGATYGKSQIGKGAKVNIEFVSANPTGPLHIGHARGAIFGDVLARLMANAGYEVTREYYANDVGVQIDKLAQSLLLRMEGKEVPEGQDLYVGDYLKELAAAMKAQGVAPELTALRKESVGAMMKLIQKELAAMSISFDKFFYESELHRANKIEGAMAVLRKKDLLYHGRLPPPKGVEKSDWNAEEQLLFKSSAFGDDSDRTIQKANKDWTYFAGDGAYHFDKIERGFDELVNVFGADHSGYVKRLNAMVAAFSDNKTPLTVCLMHLVRVVLNGKAQMMSKRAGTFILLQELLDEIGADALRFVMLTRKHDAPLDIDLALLKEQSNDNPVFYVQYAHARCCSVLEQAGKQTITPAELTRDNLSLLTHPDELTLCQHLGFYPKEVEEAAREKTPHRLAFYLLALAGQFHTLWSRGNEEDSLKFFVAEDKLQTARLGLVCATKQTLRQGLGLMGITAREELR